MIESERDQHRVFKVYNSHKLQQQVATPKKITVGSTGLRLTNIAFETMRRPLSAQNQHEFRT
jgi:hypothetical protein